METLATDRINNRCIHPMHIMELVFHEGGYNFPLVIKKGVVEYYKELEDHSFDEKRDWFFIYDDDSIYFKLLTNDIISSSKAPRKMILHKSVRLFTAYITEYHKMIVKKAQADGVTGCGIYKKMDFTSDVCKEIWIGIFLSDASWAVDIIFKIHPLFLLHIIPYGDCFLVEILSSNDDIYSMLPCHNKHVEFVDKMTDYILEYTLFPDRPTDCLYVYTALKRLAVDAHGFRRFCYIFRAFFDKVYNGSPELNRHSMVDPFASIVSQSVRNPSIGPDSPYNFLLPYIRNVVTQFHDGVPINLKSQTRDLVVDVLNCEDWMQKMDLLQTDRLVVFDSRVETLSMIKLLAEKSYERLDFLLKHDKLFQFHIDSKIEGFNFMNAPTMKKNANFLLAYMESRKDLFIDSLYIYEQAKRVKMTSELYSKYVMKLKDIIDV